MTFKQFWKQAWPWLIGVGILVLVAVRVPIDAFRDAINEGPHGTLFVVDLLITLGLLVSDSVATWIGLAVVRVRLRPFEVLAMRGATYLLSLLNYVVGQGGFGFYLARAGVPSMRAVSATLFLTGTTFATLLVLTTATWAVENGDAVNPGLWWTLIGGCIAFALYLVVIALHPAALVRREAFASLFDAKLTGHATAIIARLPHVIVIVLGHWFAMRAWGIPVPFGAAVISLPAVVIAAALPISPAGLGTSQVALVYLFSDYSMQATTDGRAAAMFAFSTVHFVYCIVGQAIVGIACIPLARRAIKSATARQVHTTSQCE